MKYRKGGCSQCLLASDEGQAGGHGVVTRMQPRCAFFSFGNCSLDPRDNVAPLLILYGNKTNEPARSWEKSFAQRTAGRSSFVDSLE